MTIYDHSNPPDLTATIFHIKSTQTGELRATHGRHTHACFFSMLQEISPQLVDKIHHSDRGKPFTVSGIYPVASERDHFQKKNNKSILIRAGDCFKLRITTMTRELSEAVIQMRNNIQMIKLDSLPFEIVHSDMYKDDRASSTTYEELLHWIDKRPPSTFGLNFISGTCFHSFNKNVVFPTPDFIFPRLLSRWNNFAPEQCRIPDEEQFSQAIDFFVMVSGYSLNTLSLNFGPKGQQISFVGSCEYQTMHKTPEIISQIMNVLMRFSFFSGVGYGTPRGMGQTDFFVKDI